MPEVSVVIPSFNHAAYIGRAIESVIHQTEEDWELIIVDDGSTDNSVDVIETFSDRRIQLVRQENHGAHAAINAGLRKSASPYLTILNSDDVYYPDRLAVLSEILRNNPEVGLCGSYIEVIDDRDKPLGVKHGYHDLEPWPLANSPKSFRAGEDLRAALLTENYWSTTSNFFFSRAMWMKTGDFIPLRYTHDWDYALRLASAGNLVLNPTPLLKYRVHASNTIRENQAAMIFEICWILAVHLPMQLQAGWFLAEPAGKRFDALLHSIYVFGMEKILISMLAQDLAHDQNCALQLLDPRDPVRMTYLSFITDHIGQQEAEEHNRDNPGRRLSMIKRLWLALKRVSQA